MTTEEKQEVPKPLLYFVDESSYWADAVLQLTGGKIFGVYLFDASIHGRVAVADPTPSYEMRFIESVPLERPEDDAVSEQLSDVMMEADNCSDEFRYYYIQGILRQLATAPNIPLQWDHKTAPFVMHTSTPDPTDADMWLNYLRENDDNERDAHNSFMEDLMEDLRANSRY